MARKSKLELAQEERKARVKRANAHVRAVNRARRAAGYPDDVQQKQVYKWLQGDSNLENASCDWTLEQCQRFINYIWHAYYGNNAKPPKAKAGRGSVNASANRWQLVLPLWARNRTIILHEVAHALLDAFSPSRHEGHGPQFVRLLIELHVAYGCPSREYLIRTAREHGLTIAKRNEVPKRLRCKGNTLRDCAASTHYLHEKEDAWMRKGKDRVIRPRKHASRTAAASQRVPNQRG